MRSLHALLFFALILLIAIPAAMYEEQKGNNSLPTHSQTDTISSMNTSALSLTSSAFANGASIPAKYTCDGKRDMNPPLSIAGVPENTKSLALIMDDPDVPKQLRSDGVFDHWILFNIPPVAKEIMQGTTVGEVGANSAGQNTYTGPCPPSQYEPSEHRYIFTLYALDTMLPLHVGASKTDVLNAIHGHMIGQTQLIGRYKR